MVKQREKLDENGIEYMTSKEDMDAYVASQFGSNHKGVKVKDEIKRLRLPVKYDSQHATYIGSKRIKGWFRGIKKKPDEEIEDFWTKLKIYIKTNKIK